MDKKIKFSQEGARSTNAPVYLLDAREVYCALYSIKYFTRGESDCTEGEAV